MQLESDLLGLELCQRGMGPDKVASISWQRPPGISEEKRFLEKRKLIYGSKTVCSVSANFFVQNGPSINQLCHAVLLALDQSCQNNRFNI